VSRKINVSAVDDDDYDDKASIQAEYALKS
jgi:hypothetical protein